jgi:hypothetical protein
MADNSLQVVLPDGSTPPLESEDVGSGVMRQIVGQAQKKEVPVVSGTVADYRFQVNAAAAKPLTALATARFARVRLLWSGFDPANPAAGPFCYYRSDGVDPTSNGANAFGWFQHGELNVVAVSPLSNFRMIGSAAMTGQFEVYVEYLK